MNEIRRMTVQDVDAVTEIEKATFARPWTREDFLREMEVNKVARYLVYVLDGEIVGYAGAWVILDESHITNIAIREDMRGRGYGKALVKALLQYLSNLGAEYATLEVRVSNATARHVYESLGFVRMGKRPHYYEDNGEDALLMVCADMPEAEEDFEEPETVTE